MNVPEDLRRKIERLMALAASTPFEAEKEAALDKAMVLRGRLGPDDEDPLAEWSADERAYNRWLNDYLETEAVVMVVLDLGAVPWDETHWVIPGYGPALDRTQLFALWRQRIMGAAA